MLSKSSKDNKFAHSDFITSETWNLINTKTNIILEKSMNLRNTGERVITVESLVEYSYPIF